MKTKDKGKKDLVEVVHGLVIIRIARIKLGIDFGRVIMKKVFEFFILLAQNLYLPLEILSLRFKRFILLSRCLAVVKKRRIPRVRATIDSLIMPKAVNRICHIVACSIALHEEPQGLVG